MGFFRTFFPLRTNAAMVAFSSGSGYEKDEMNSRIVVE